MKLKSSKWNCNELKGTEIHGNHLMAKLILTASKPLLFLQSKLFCFSLFYLFASLFLALYVISSQSKCLFRSPLYDPIQPSSLFSYPSSYGQHKYAISTTRSTCSSPINFSGTRLVMIPQKSW